MKVQCDCAPAGCTAEARGDTTPASDTSVAQHEVVAWAGKALAMLLYNLGARSLAATSATFARHPSWREA